MEPELEQRLHASTKEQLVQLLRELAERRPVLLVEIATILDRLEETPQTADAMVSEGREDAQAGFNADELVMRRPPHHSEPPSLDLHACRQYVEGYASRLEQGEAPQAIFDDLVTLLQEAETCADRLDQQYHLQALNVYALVLDTRLATRNPALTSIFDRAIDEFMPMLATLLAETSSTVEFDAAAITPLLTAGARQHWLERLFALWLKRLDLYHTEENLPEIILEVAWEEDVAVLRALVQGELHQQQYKDHSNIVDFSHQSRLRILEKFLKELPPV